MEGYLVVNNKIKFKLETLKDEFMMGERIISHGQSQNSEMNRKQIQYWLPSLFWLHSSFLCFTDRLYSSLIFHTALSWLFDLWVSICPVIIIELIASSSMRLNVSQCLISREGTYLLLQTITQLLGSCSTEYLIIFCCRMRECTQQKL